jgi:hypothetical protein
MCIATGHANECDETPTATATPWTNYTQHAIYGHTADIVLTYINSAIRTHSERDGSMGHRSKQLLLGSNAPRSLVNAQQSNHAEWLQAEAPRKERVMPFFEVKS